MINIYEFLNKNGIFYEKFDHPAVFTCDQASELCQRIPGYFIKNLFLYDKKTGQYFLVVVGKEKQHIDLKQLKKLLGTSNLSFASPQQLKDHLGVEPGSVTILGLINDHEHAIRIIFDIALEDKSLQCHPLVNTATLVIPFDGIKKFLNITNHAFQFFDIPEHN